MAVCERVLLRPERENMPPTDVAVGEYFTQEIQLLENYANNVTRDGRSINHPVRTCAYLSDFSNGRLEPEVYAAALLHDVAQTARPEQGRSAHLNTDLYTKNATRLLRTYSNSDYARQRLPDGKLTRWEYISGILSDLNVVEEYAEANRGLKNGKSAELLSLLSGHSIGEVESKFWLEPSALTRPAQMAELLGTEKVNLEAVLIKAAEKLDSLFRPPDNKRSLLRNLHDAESFYAPLCEIIGYDGLASALRSQANIIRLQESGHGAFADKAQAIIDGLGDREEALNSIEGLLGKLSLGEVIVDHAFKDTTGHGIALGTAMIELRDGSDDSAKKVEARAIWRIKSVGSLAMKLLRDHEDLLWKDDRIQRQELGKVALLPGDVLGITVVAQEENALASLFSRAAVAAHDDNDIALTNVPSRDKAYHITGPLSFVRNMVGALTLDRSNRAPDGTTKIGPENIDIPEKPTKYEVAKFTCEHDGMRTEIQFQTEEARVEARIGLAAHLLYKLKKLLKETASGTADDDGNIIKLTEVEVTAMKSIHDRANSLGTYVLADQDNARRRAFIKRINGWILR